MSSINQVSVTAKELSDLYGVSEKYISELVNDHNHPKVAWNEFNLYESLKWWIKYKEEIHRREIEKIKEDDPQKSLARSNKKLKDLDYEERIGSLLPLEVVKMAWVEEVKIIGKALDGLPTKVAPRLVNLSDEEEAVSILNDEINKIRNRIGDLPIVASYSEDGEDFDYENMDESDE